MIAVETQGLRRVVVLSSTFPQYEGDPRGQFIVGYWQERAQREALEVHFVVPQTKWCDGTWQGEIVHTQSGARCWIHRFAYARSEWSSLTGHFGLMENIRHRPWRALLLPGFFAAQFRAMRQAVAELQPAFVAAHMILPGGWPIGAWAQTLALPYELFIHGTDLDLALVCPAWLSKHVLRWPLRRELGAVLQRAAIVHFPSQAKIATCLRKLGYTAKPEHWRVETMRSLAQSSLSAPAVAVRRERILFIGRLIAQKGLDVLLHALAQLDEPPLLDVAGDGPLRASLQRLAKKYGVRAHFHGFVDLAKRDELYASARLVCVPSRASGALSEGAPLVIAEARERQIPVIASALGGIPELCADDPQCTLVAVDDAQALALALGAALGVRLRALADTRAAAWRGVPA
jgi:glycosyltransferase involved in cell wall biosynthesis